MTAHATIYGSAALYELAFSYRKFDREGAFLRGLFAARRGRVAQSFLELAAGPARHALEMGGAGLEVGAVDISREMADYARSMAEERGLKLSYRVADMGAFVTARRYDLAACMLCSATYLLTGAAVIAHFACVRSALAQGGMYVIELPHESELEKPRTRSAWSVRDAHGELDVEWGAAAPSSPGRIWPARVRLSYRSFDGGEPTVVSDEAEQRDFTLPEIEALAAAAGLTVEAVFGGLDQGLSLDDPAAWRMVVVLGRTA